MSLFLNEKDKKTIRENVQINVTLKQETLRVVTITMICSN